MENLKFNVKKCFEYIESLEDFRMDFQGSKTTFDERKNIVFILGENENIKPYLKKFLIECKEKSEQTMKGI